MSGPRRSTRAFAVLLAFVLLSGAPVLLAKATAGPPAPSATIPAVSNTAPGSPGPPAPAAGSAPVADFVSHTQGMTVRFDGSMSSAPLGRSITAYSWTFGDGSTASGAAAAHTYALSGRYSVVLAVTDSSSASANTTRYVSVAPSTVDIRFDDMFQADCPYGAWWTLRFHTYGDVILNNSIPCRDFYPWILYSQAQGDVNPSWVYTLFHMSADVTNFPGYSVAEPVMLPVFNYSATPGQYLYYNFTFDYLDSASISYWDTTAWPVNSKYSDGFGYLVRGNITMDLQESRRVFGVEANTPAQAQAWWDANTKYGGVNPTGIGNLEARMGTWLDDLGNSKYDIYNGFLWFYESDIADLNATVNPTTGQTTVRVFLDGWGLDVLLSRWFYWGNVSYRDAVNAPYGQYAPAGWMPFERCWCENVTVNATIRSGLDLRYSGVRGYELAAVGMPGADGVVGTSDDLAGWAYGPYLMDYVPPLGSNLPGASEYPNSELKWYIGAAHTITSPGSYAYGQQYEYIEVPARWNMSTGHSLTIAMPTDNVTWYDPARSTWDSALRIGNYTTFQSRIQGVSVQPAGEYWLWDNASNVFSMAAQPGFVWPNSPSLPFDPAPYIVFQPGRDTVPPQTASSLQGTAGHSGWYRSAVTVTLMATDDSGGAPSIRYREDGGIWLPYAGPFVVTGDGTHSVEYYAVDNAGNTESTQTIPVKIDTIAPSISVSPLGTAGTGGWFLSNVTLSLIATDSGSGVWSSAYRLDTGGWTTYLQSFVVGGSGIHTIQYAATDVAGNAEATQIPSVRIDLTEPQLNVLGPTGTLHSSTVEVTWSATEAVSGLARYEVNVDGDGFVSVSTNTSVTLTLADGAHVVQVRATSGAGSTATASTSFAVDASFFSLTGPYAGLLILLIAIAAGAVVGAVLVIWYLRRKAPPPAPPPAAPPP